MAGRWSGCANFWALVMTPFDVESRRGDDENLSRVMACDALLNDAGIAPSTRSANIPSQEDRGRERLRLLLKMLEASEPSFASTASDRGAEGQRADEPRSLLERFEVLDHLGSGGFGFVVRARDRLLGREVALKMPLPERLLSSGDVHRFLREARAAAWLDHPNIVRVHDAGELGVLGYFIASEFCAGKSLREWLRDQSEPVPPRLAARWVAELADAVRHAHERGILHRDIKPDNVIVTGGPEPDELVPRLTDFGLAKVVEENGDKTRSGVLIGTPAYMAPEQAERGGAEVGAPADIYALGVTLYESLCGRPPFRGETDADTLRLVLDSQPPALRSLRAGVPRDLETICLKCLRREPGKRYASAASLCDDLRLYLDGRPIVGRPVSTIEHTRNWSRRHFWQVTVAGLGAILTLGALLGWMWFHESRQVQDRTRTALKTALDERDERQRLVGRHNYVAQIRRAAQAIDDGQFEPAQEVLRDIPPLNAGIEAPRSFVWRYLWRQARRDVEVLVGPTPHLIGMALSSDGKLLATSDETAGLQIRDAATGTVIRDVERVAGRIEGPVFSPDGLHVAAPERATNSESPDGFSIWDVASGRRLARLPVDRGFALACRFLPESGFLGLAARADIEPLSRDRLWSLADGLEHPRLVEQFDRSTVVDSDSFATAILTHETPGVVLLRSVRTGKGVRRFEVKPNREHISGLACSRTGEFIAVVSEPSWRLTVWDGCTGALLASHAVPEHAFLLSFSPDGATVAAEDPGGDVYLIDRVTGAVHRIVTGPADPHRTRHFAFSLDGRRLASALSGSSKNNDSGPVSVWEVASGRRLATFRGRSEDLGKPVFSPDGRSLLISSASGVRRWRLTARDDDKDRQPAGHKDEAWSVAFSPDGRTLATGSDDSEPGPTIKLWDTVTGRSIRAWRGGSGTVAALAYSPDGHILASGHLTVTKNIRIWEASTGRLLTTLEGHTDRVRSVNFDRDGRRLATAGSDGTIRLWDVATWTQQRVLDAHADTVHSVAFSPDGKTLASAGNDGNARLWNLDRDSEVPQRIVPTRANLMSLAFSPDGKTLALADIRGSITLWDTERSTPVRVIHTDGDEVRQVAFAPDGTALASAGHRGLIRVWDPVTGQELVGLAGNPAQINGLAFSPDGSIVAAAAHDGSVRLWRADREKRCQEPLLTFLASGTSLQHRLHARRPRADPQWAPARSALANRSGTAIASGARRRGLGPAVRAGRKDPGHHQ
jgi:WD40 repeat protein/serine/threonine protein kinase